MTDENRERIDKINKEKDEVLESLQKEIENIKQNSQNEYIKQKDTITEYENQIHEFKLNISKLEVYYHYFIERKELYSNRFTR